MSKKIMKDNRIMVHRMAECSRVSCKGACGPCTMCGIRCGIGHTRTTLAVGETYMRQHMVKIESNQIESNQLDLTVGVRGRNGDGIYLGKCGFVSRIREEL